MENDGTPFRVVWRPQDGAQTCAFFCDADDLFFGGARGGGKSDLILGKTAFHCLQHGSDARCLIVRREYQQLSDLIERATEIFQPFGARPVGKPVDFRWPNGALVRFRDVWDERAAAKYQGHSYTLICAEELTNWPSLKPVFMLKATLRSAAGIPCRFMATGNPGGLGHNAVKARYIDPAPAGYTTIADPELDETRVFIPSRLEDNPALIEADPRYENRILAAAGSPELAKAWREGIWDIVVGGFFDDVWNPRQHVIRPFEVPSSWTRMVGFDWGSARPSACYWAAISDGSEVQVDGKKRSFARGSVVLYRELYTVSESPNGQVEPNVGLRLNNEELGRRVADMTNGDGHALGVADSSIWDTDRGPSIFEQMCRGAGHRLPWEKADKRPGSRQAGASIFRQYMQGAMEDPQESPGLFVFSNCRHFIRTVPTLQRDQRKPEDVETHAEDHAYDAVRYLLMKAAGPRGMQKAKLGGF